MERWQKDDSKVIAAQNASAAKNNAGVPGMPHWRAERDIRGRTDLQPPGGVKGGGSALGKDVEDALMVTAARAAQRGCPYLCTELADMMRDTAIAMGVVSPRTKKLYTSTTDVSTMVSNFVRRCKDQGIVLLGKKGVPLSMARAAAGSLPRLKAYVEKMNHPETGLGAFQDKIGKKLTLLDVGNFDEFRLDTIDYASKGGLYVCLDGWPDSVIVSCEQSPHITILYGFMGATRLATLIIRIGDEYEPPHPYHCSLLQTNCTVFIAQSPTGWIDKRLKAAWFKMLLAMPEMPVGKGQAKVFNFDGHSTNTHNAEMHEAMWESQIFSSCPPSHTSAGKAGGTQQLDLAMRLFGPIAVAKACIRQKLRRHFRWAFEYRKGVVKFSEICAIVEMSLLEVWPNDGSMAKKAMALNKSVGYYIDERGYLAYDILRVMDPTSIAASGTSEASASMDIGHFRSPSLVARDDERRKINALLDRKQESMHAFANSVRKHHESPLGDMAQQLQPPRKKRMSANANGLIIDLADCVNEQKAAAQAVLDKATAKSDKTANFWLKHGADALEAEKMLATPGALLTNLKPKYLASLIISRTGHCKKATSNKDGKMLAEAVAAVTAQSTSLCPLALPAAHVEHHEVEAADESEGMEAADENEGEKEED
jgi:hypothetical protein